MTDEQVKKAARLYHLALVPPGEPIRADLDKSAREWTTRERNNHLVWMCEQIDKGRVTGEKAQRWLSFMQGVLSMMGIYSINALRRHNAAEMEIP